MQPSQALPAVTLKDLSYRPEIDGLRAVAVLSVILFHAHRPLLPGGFVGVDIFFVISGFLITRNILHQLQEGVFSVAEFYRRRIKRIAPVMLVVVGTTLVASQILLLPGEEPASAARSAAFSLASFANVYFWKFRNTSYFAPDSAQLPLLHLWSLGVEEQFYLAWPILLLVCYRPTRTKVLRIATIALVVFSFLAGDALYTSAPSFVYYMLPARAGELLLGALAAMTMLWQKDNRMPQGAINGITTVGIAMILASLFLIAEGQPFPGWRAAVPTAGAALIIFAGNSGTSIWSKLLASRPLIWVGLVSYSAYLWHWPILAFYRYGYGEPGLAASAIAVALTFFLAWVTYRTIEQPARRSKASLGQVLFRQYLVPAGALIGLALVAVKTGRLGLSVHSESFRAHLAAARDQTRPAYDYPWVCQRQRITGDDLTDPHCVLGRPLGAVPTAVLWGDSQAAHYVGMVEAFADAAGFRFRNVEIGSCPPLYADPGPFVRTSRLADCRASLDLVRPAIDQFSVVILSSAWLGYGEGSRYLDAALETAGRLSRAGKLVILIGAAPRISGYDRRCREKALIYPLLRCARLETPIPREVVAINAALRRFAEVTPNVRYFDANEYLCPKGICSAFGPDGEPRYYDESHLSLPASSKLGREIIKGAGLPPVFTLIQTETAPKT
jgi:peptidoglycan/LPS O-acetylase OafA/YrhL